MPCYVLSNGVLVNIFMSIRTLMVRMKERVFPSSPLVIFYPPSPQKKFSNYIVQLVKLNNIET